MSKSEKLTYREKQALSAIETQRFKFMGAIAAILDVFEDVLEDAHPCGEVRVYLRKDAEADKKWSLPDFDQLDLKDEDLARSDRMQQIAEELNDLLED